MESLNTIFNGSKDFNVESCNKGEKTYVAKLVSKTVKVISGLEVNSKLTLYISLAKATKEEVITIDSKDFNWFESEFMPEDSDEIYMLKWITPAY